MTKKRRIKLTKSHKKIIKRHGIHAGWVLLGVLVTLLIGNFIHSRAQPKNIVWAADRTIKIPSGLKPYLLKQEGCREYRGKGSPTGVGLWSVYQTSNNKFAKIAYGCSWTLNTYVMAIRDKSGWQLLDPNKYFAPFRDAVDPSKGALPYCAVVEKYKIDKTIEPFCVNPDSTARANNI